MQSDAAGKITVIVTCETLEEYYALQEFIRKFSEVAAKPPSLQPTSPVPQAVKQVKEKINKASDIIIGICKEVYCNRKKTDHCTATELAMFMYGGKSEKQATDKLRLFTKNNKVKYTTLIKFSQRTKIPVAEFEKSLNREHFHGPYPGARIVVK